LLWGTIQIIRNGGFLDVLKFLAQKNAILGVDIGTSSIKVVQARTSGKKVILEKVGFAPIPMDNARSEKLEPSDLAVADAVKAAISDSGSSYKDICCSISGDAVIVRYLTMPEMTDDELNYAVRLQAEEYIPFRLEEVNLDFYRLNPAGKDTSKKIDIILVAARKDLVTRRMEILKSIGLNPVMMDIDSFAILNCIEANYVFPADEVIALIGIGATNCNINIFENGVSRFARDIVAGGFTVTQSVASRFGMTLDEAEKVKIQEGAVFPQDAAATDSGGIAEVIKDTVEQITGEAVDTESRKNKLAASIRQPIQNLITEVRRSLQFFENQANGKPINRILLTGGGSKLKNLDHYMSERLGLPVQVVNPLENVDVSGLNKDSAKMKDLAPHLAVGIGLGLRRVGDK